MNSLSTRLLAATIITILLMTPALSIAQKQNIDISKAHNEVQDDPYLPMLPKEIKTSPAYSNRTNGFWTTQVNVNEDGDNILGDAANEPSIAVDPTNSDRIVIGWRQFDNVASNFRQAGYGYSTEAGLSWSFPGPIDAGVFRSDPVLGVDNNGNFYYNSLTKDVQSNYWCDVYRTDNTGFEWDEGTFAQGGDKQWMRIDPTGGIGSGNVYAFWTSSFSICDPGFYTRSTDGGDSYEECDGIPGNPRWGTLTVGPDGELYIVGATSTSGVVAIKSSTAQDPALQTTWDFSIYIDLDGNLGFWPQVNPEGLLGQVWIDADRSDGIGRGNVYVLASVVRESNNDPADVMFTRSTDGGNTWDDPIRINTDIDSYPFNYQWFGTMSVAPNGRIDVVWLDTRDAVGNPFMSALYYSFSIDQGITWSENEKLSDSFDPHLGWPNQNKMGDYFDMVSDNEGAHLAWANTLNGEQDVYYGHINPMLVGIDNKAEGRSYFSFSNYPNPFKGKTTLRYELDKNSNVSIFVFDIYGNIVTTIIEESQEAGTHNIVFDASNFAGGIYFCRLSTGERMETLKLTLID